MGLARQGDCEIGRRRDRGWQEKRVKGKSGRGNLRAEGRIEQTRCSTGTRTYRHVSPDGAAPRSCAISAKRA